MDTRPTPDRLRESLFSILTPVIEECIFADLCAGTGAVGIEALSRGAKHAIFIESNRAALNVIRQNLKTLGIESRADVRQAKAHAAARTIQADIVFLDPPYHAEREYGVVLSEIHAPLVIAQHDVRLELGEVYGNLRHTRTVRQGDNCLSFFESAGDAGDTIEEAGA